MEGFDIVKRGQIDGDFEGFDEEVLFKLMDGTYWIQDEYKYWYHYAYCPEALILSSGGRLFIQVDGQNEIVPVREVYNVIESKIDGEFKGWEGDTQYKLVNGQVWQQSKHKYKYKYKYMPKVLIYQTSSGMVMDVAGTRANVQRIM